MCRHFSTYGGSGSGKRDVAVRRGEAGPGADDAPAIGPVQAEVPGARRRPSRSRAARPPRVDQSVTAVQLFGWRGMLDRLEDVRLAGPAVGVVAAAVDVELDVTPGPSAVGLAAVTGAGT